MLATLRILLLFKKLWTLFPIFIVSTIFIAMNWSNWFVLAIAFGFFSQGIVEYCMHRFLYHDEPSIEQSAFNKLYRTHIGHHEFPTNPEFLTGGERGLFEVTVGLLLASVHTVILWPFVGLGPAMMFAIASVFVGNLAGFILYEYCHTLAHLNVKKGWLGQKITRDHLAHHYQDHHANFHVSFTAGWVDWLFGTPLDKAKAKERFDRKTLLSLGMDPDDARLVIARQTFDLPENPGVKTNNDLSKYSRPKA